MVDTQTALKRSNFNLTNNAVYPTHSRNEEFKYSTERSWQDNYDMDRDVQCSSRDLQSVQFNSTGNRSFKGFTSQHILNDRVNTNDDIDDPPVDIEPIIRPEEPTICESEVKLIIKQFNETIDGQTKEKLELEKKIYELEDRIDSKQQIVRRLYGEREKMVMDIEATTIRLDETVRGQEDAEKKFKATMGDQDDVQLLDFGIENANAQQDFINKVRETLRNETLIAQIQNEVFERFEALKQQRTSLIAENSQLRIQLADNFHKNKNSETKCQKCKEYYTPLHNNEDACKFHPGKLKFYSCRGCGADQYYNCCNRCITCSKGCKSSKHIA